jgi:hypothetical protein
MTDTIADVQQSDIEEFTGKPASTVLTVSNKDLAPMMASPRNEWERWGWQR